MKKLSIIIPVFNEESSIHDLVSELNDVFGNDNSIEVIFINDGSTDSSQSKLEDNVKRYDSFKLVNLYRNYGKSIALQAGIEVSNGNLIATLDSDLQDNPAELKNLISEIENGYDLVTGWKENRKDSFEKRFASKIFNFFVKLFSGLKINDSNTGIKVLKKEVASSLNLYGGRHRYIPLLAHQKKYKVSEVSVEHRERKYGISKYGSERYKDGFFDFLTILFLGKYMDRPLHFFGGLGFTSILFGVLSEIYVLHLKYNLGHSFQQHIALIIFGSLLIITGLQLFTFGLIGEIIVNRNQKAKNYIKEIIG